MKAGFDLNKMREIKREELSEVHNLLSRHISRERPVFAFEHPAREDNGIIAEIKRHSPSKKKTRGEVCRISAAEQAERYIAGGACALSVLTDANYFGGSWSDLYGVARRSRVPVLCKEFIFFREQLDLAWRLGADMALLIARMLSRDELRDLYSHAVERGLVPLVEVHHSRELAEVLELNPELLLVNSRNLSSLAIDSATAERTFAEIPPGTTGIWASGINDAAGLAAVRAGTGARYFLVGTSLMEAEDPAKMLKEFSDVR